MARFSHLRSQAPMMLRDMATFGADSIRRQGAARAQAQAQSGQIWGRAIEQLGIIPQQMATMKEMAQIGDLRSQRIAGLKEEAEQRRLAREKLKAYTDTLTRHTKIDPEGNVKADQYSITRDLFEIDPTLAQEYEQGRMKQQEELARKNLADLKLEQQQIDMLGDRIYALEHADPSQRPTLYGDIRRWAEGQGMMDEQLSAAFPVEWSDELLSALKAVAASSDIYRQELQNEIERKDPEFLGKWYDLASQTMSPAKSQGHWTMARNFLASKRPPEGIMDLIPEQYSEQARQSVLQLGLTAAQQQPKSENLSDLDEHLERYAKKHGYQSRHEIPYQESLRAMEDFSGAHRKPEQEKEPSDLQKAQAEYRYQQRVNQINAQRQKDMQALEEELTYGGPGMGLPEGISERTRAGVDEQSHTLRAGQIQEKYAKLLEAARREYLAAIGEKFTPETPANRPSLRREKHRSGKVLDEATARKLLAQAGGDKQKARREARRLGYIIPE